MRFVFIFIFVTLILWIQGCAMSIGDPSRRQLTAKRHFSEVIVYDKNRVIEKYENNQLKKQIKKIKQEIRLLKKEKNLIIDEAIHLNEWDYQFLRPSLKN